MSFERASLLFTTSIPRQREWRTINAGPRLLLHIASCTMSWQRMGSRPSCCPWAPKSRHITTSIKHCLGIDGRAIVALLVLLLLLLPMSSLRRNHPHFPCICRYSVPKLLCHSGCLPGRDGGTDVGEIMLTATVIWAGIYEIQVHRLKNIATEAGLTDERRLASPPHPAKWSKTRSWT